MNGWIWGYDPGGTGNHGVAKLRLVDSAPVELQLETRETLQDAIDWFGDQQPLGIGIDTLTCWCTGPSPRSSVISPSISAPIRKMCEFLGGFRGL